jgi:hypothetical protein
MAVRSAATDPERLVPWRTDVLIDGPTAAAMFRHHP